MVHARERNLTRGFSVFVVGRTCSTAATSWAAPAIDTEGAPRGSPGPGDLERYCSAACMTSVV